MTPFARGVLADLRSGRLLPVAIVLALALLAVPVLLRETPPAPAPAADVAASPAATATAPGGLPAPDAALASQPLVTMATLNRPSALRSFDTRDPFEPLRTLEQVARDEAAGEPAVDSAPAGGGSGDAPTDVTISGGIGGVETPNAPLDPTGGAPAPPTPRTEDPEPDLDLPARDPEPRRDPEPETYAVDVSFAGPEQARQVRGLPRLAMLPHASVPLLIFIGVSDGGEATFLVDSKLRPYAGEGACRPSAERCATVGLEPGERQTFLDDEGRTYVLQLDQVRTVTVEQAIARRRATDAQAARAESAPQRFLPVLVDIFGG